MSSNGTRWQSRIIREDVVDADQLLANPYNWRIHPKAQQDALASVLDTVGWVQRIIVNARTGHVVDGHLRASLAISRGEQVPVAFVDLTEDEERLILATIDPLAGMAATDAEMLEGILADLRETELVQGDDGLDALLHSIAAGADVPYGEYDVPDDPGPQLDRAEELRDQWGTERGQVWSVPSVTVPGRSHRVMCGDATSEADVATLMQGEKAQAIVTDPLYGVRYEGGRNPVSNVPRDSLKGDDSPDLYFPFLYIWLSFTTARATFYLWFAGREGHSVFDAVRKAGLMVRALIVWNKIDAHYGNFMAQYMQKHEPCLYCVRGSTDWYGPANEVSVWDIKQPTTNPNHPTEKPAECMGRPIANSVAPGGLAADGFIGSGTTVVAAEQLGRICYGMDIEPKYVAVTLQRLADMGLVPELTAHCERY